MKKELSEMTLEELWELFPIILSEHKDCWNDWYREEEKRIAGFLSIKDIRISHIGSTAINKIWAKPIIDILLEIPAAYSMNQVKQLLVNNGYICMSEEERRKSFNRGYTNDGFAERVFHLHLRYLGDNDELYFRDYMNEHPEIAKEYEKLKQSLWKKYEHNRDAYTDAKTDFIKKHTECAKREYGSRMKMTNEMIRRIAMEQSAIDANCNVEDFCLYENVIVASKEHPQARKYLKLPHVCNLISYGNNIVAAIDEKFRNIVSEYINKYSVEHCFETPNMHVLNDEVQKQGYRVCFMAEYFLPDVNILRELPCEYELKILTPGDFTNLYVKEWSNALCEDRKELDVLGVGAYDNGMLIGLAGCSADCDTMWQIGVDVLPEYRKQGIASALTSRLAIEIIERGKVPFYCCAWSNIKSARNAIKSGFRPAWVEMTVKDAEVVADMNKQR